MNRFVISLVLITSSALLAFSSSSNVDDSKSMFKTPPQRTKIYKIVHSLPDSEEARLSLFNKLQTQGFGGIVCNVSFDGYLTDESKWQSFLNGVKTAKEMGFSMWLYDERGYPSGNAGGLVLKGHSEWEARGLLIITTNVTAGSAVTFDIPEGKLFYARAFIKERSGALNPNKFFELNNNISNKVLQWNAPPGEYIVYVVVEGNLYEGTHAELNLWQKIPYINLLQKEPTERFLKLTHQQYADRLGGNLGQFFEATFTDEPSLMSLYLRQMPWTVLPWSDNLPSEFKRRRGYDIMKTIPALFSELDENYKKRRYDFWLTIGELVSENYFGQIRDWCRKHNIESGGHLLAEESIVNHVPLYGDFFRSIQTLDAPGIDCLTSIPSEVPWYIAKLAQSAAQLQGRKIVMCETSDHIQTYRPKGDQRPKRIVTESEIRGTLNRLFINGVNRITSYYSFAQLTDEQINRLNQWAGRCAIMVESSTVAPQIAVLYPVESLWIRFTPSHLWTREATQAAKIESIYKSAIDGLFFSQRDFLIIDSNTIEKGLIKDGTLSYNGLKFNIIILPGADTLSLRSWRNLSEFVKSGGMLFILGNLPKNSDQKFPSSEVIKLAQSWFNNQIDILNDTAAQSRPLSCKFGKGVVNFLPIGLESVVADLLEFSKQVKFAGSHNYLRISKRKIGDNSLFFIINDSDTDWSGRIEFAGCGEGELWNPFDGAVNSVSGNSFSNLRIEPYGARFFKFKKDNYDANIASKMRTSAFSLKTEKIKSKPPATGKGEFVKSEINDEVAGDNKILWNAMATLTKSDVDTWLFLSFKIDDASQIKIDNLLSFKIRIPSGQKTRNQILVIIKEKNGGDFIADTGSFLDESGEKTIFVPLKKFRLAGWSKDENGILDVNKIEEIRIGWGGYIGKEGETISFASSAPEITRLNFN
ncbi:MAG: glycosyl hydrolase [Verrucomicrobiia bacterium]